MTSSLYSFDVIALVFADVWIEQEEALDIHRSTTSGEKRC